MSDQSVRMYIGGDWVKGGSGDVQDIVNPASGHVIGQVCLANAGDLERALASAGRGLQDWGAVPAWERGTILKDAAPKSDAS